MLKRSGRPIIRPVMRVLVLGGGPAGTTAALQAAELGADVTLVEAKRLGGTSLNEGPAPIRTLARAARLIRDTRSWERFGLRGDAPHVDIAAALDNASQVADYAHEQKRLADVVRSQGIDLIQDTGPALFVDPHTVRIPDGRTLAGTPSSSCGSNRSPSSSPPFPPSPRRSAWPH